MKVQSVKRRIQLQEWAEQVTRCNQSGQPVKHWCVENGINLKTYYNRAKRVREELLESIEANGSIQLPRLASSYEVSDKPVFTALPIPQAQGAAVTVCLSECAVEIRNGADHALVEQVLRVVARL